MYCFIIHGRFFRTPMLVGTISLFLLVFDILLETVLSRHNSPPAILLAATHSNSWKGRFMGNKERRHCPLWWVPVWLSVLKSDLLYADLNQAVNDLNLQALVMWRFFHFFQAGRTSPSCCRSRLPPAALKALLNYVETLTCFLYRGFIRVAALASFEDQILDPSGTDLVKWEPKND